MLTPALSTLADFDAALLAEYASFRRLLPEAPVAAVQRRFAQYGVFPKLGWGLIAAGERQALADDNPGVLHATLTRFLHCAHHCWGPTDESGLHWGGQDHCALVVPALHGAPLGSPYLAEAFHARRPLAKMGAAPLVQAANLMVSIECPDWRHRAQAQAQAERFLAGRRRAAADDAWVRFFAAVLAQDGMAAGAALTAFAAAYPVSDWGRHKPGTASTFIAALFAYADARLPQPLDEHTRTALLPPEVRRLWSGLQASLESLNAAPYRFAEPLDFLNDLTLH